MNQAHFSIKVDDLMASMRSINLNEMPATTAQTSTEKVRMHNQRVFEEQQSKFCPADKTPEAAIVEIQNNKELSNRQKRKLIRKIKQKTWKYTKPSPFAVAANDITNNGVFLLPSKNRVPNIPSEEIVVDVVQPFDANCDGLKESVEKEEEHDNLDQKVIDLRKELKKVKEERDALLKAVTLFNEELGKVQGMQKENQILKARLGRKRAKGLSPQ